MKEWVVERTPRFRKQLKKYRKHYELLRRVTKKSKRLSKNPKKIGKHLSGNMHGLKSTRLSSSFRLIFQIDEENKKVYLVDLDHREKSY